MITAGEMLDTEQLVFRLGTKKQIDSYLRHKKLILKHKKTILKRLDEIAHYEEVKKGRNNYFHIIELKSKEDSLKIKLQNHRKFALAIDTKLISFFKQKENERNITITNNMFIKKLELTNESYWELRGSAGRFINKHKLDMEIKTVRYFSLLSRATINSIILSSLSRLERKGLITFRKVLKVVTKVGEHLEANVREKELIATAKENAIKELGCKSMRTIMFFNKGKLLDDLIKETLFKYDIDYIDKIYEAYSIEIGNLNEYETISVREKEILDNHFRMSLCETIKRATLRKKEKALREELELGFGKSLFEKIELEENFCRDIETLLQITLLEG